MDWGALFLGGVCKTHAVVHNSISLGGILIVQLCIFPCEYKAMVGDNVLEMYLRAMKFCFYHSKVCGKNHIRRFTFQ